MASLDLLPHALVADLMRNETLREALNGTEGVEDVASIVEETLDRVQPQPATKSTRPSTNEGTFDRFLIDLQSLVELVHRSEPLVRPVCEFAFDFLEWAVMGYLTSSPRGIRAMKQVWPTESAQVESILTRVKEQMEGIKDKFNEAMRVVQQAVNSRNTQQSTQALRKYEAIRGNIQPVFDTCLQYIKNAQTILKTLNPKVDTEIQESKKKAVIASSVAIVVAGIATYRNTNAWKIAVLPLCLLWQGVLEYRC